tara:strand:+ start:1342 stop:1965 length:624 start_codon:yes stop_codon:yes gene_type:complete
MRLSEKTLELNFCAGLPRALGLDVFWIGLTQEEEKSFGFDHCTNMGGMFLIIQMKRFHKRMKRSGAKRFNAPHHQMQALKNVDLLLQASGVRRFVAYAIPEASDSVELCGLRCPATCINYLDLADFPNRIPSPGRKSDMHYVDVAGSTATVHSEAFEVNVIQAGSLRQTLERSERMNVREISPDLRREELGEYLSLLSRRTALGVAV